MSGHPQVDVPTGQSGDWRVVKDRPPAISILRSNMKGRAVSNREYTRLLRNGTPVIMDTEAEYRDLVPLIYHLGHAPRILLAGLGLGYALMLAAQRDDVEHVTVVEKSPDVIRLVWPHWKERFGDKITLVEADILTWTPPRGSRWELIWFDIWDNICSDNLPQMKALKKKFARRAGVRLCWAENQIRR